MENDRFLSTLIENNSEPIFVVLKSNFNILYLNPAARTFAPGADTGKPYFSSICGRKAPCKGCTVCSSKNDSELCSVPEGKPCSFSEVLSESICWNGEDCIMIIWHDIKTDFYKYSVSGIDLAASFKCYMGNYETFLSILAVYLGVGPEKIELIKKLFDEKDYKNYRIEVHGLKGSSNTIGATKLAEFAKSLEYASAKAVDSDAESIEYIEQNTDELLRQYKEFLDFLNQYIDINNDGAIKDCDTSDDEDYSEEEAIDDTVKASLKEACELLDSYELDEAVDLLKSIKAAASKGLATKIGAIIKKINDCDYDTAGKDLQNLFSN